MFYLFFLSKNPSHDLKIQYLGTNTVKYIAPISYICLTESNSKVYNNFEMFEGQYHTHLKNTLIYKSQELSLFQEKSTYLRRWCK